VWEAFEAAEVLGKCRSSVERLARLVVGQLADDLAEPSKARHPSWSSLSRIARSVSPNRMAVIPSTRSRIA